MQFNILLVSSVLCQCRVNMRKEIRELSIDELWAYLDAAKKIHSTEELTYFTKKHYENAKSTHGTPEFLPWHRVFLNDYEKKLKQMNPKASLPYWEWSKDYEFPHSSVVFGEKYLGGDGDAKNNYCVRNGPFANMTVSFPNKHCLRRNFADKIGRAHV